MTVNEILLSDFTDPRFCAAFRQYFAELDIHVSDWDSLFSEMNAEGNNLAYLLLDEDGQLIGFLQFQMTAFSNWFLEEPFGFVREFWIVPAHRGQGHGKRLLHLAETFLTNHGAYRSILTSDEAVSFYLAAGYEKMPGITAKNGLEVLAKSLHQHS